MLQTGETEENARSDLNLHTNVQTNALSNRLENQGRPCKWTEQDSTKAGHSLLRHKGDQ